MLKLYESKIVLQAVQAMMVSGMCIVQVWAGGQYGVLH